MATPDHGFKITDKGQGQGHTVAGGGRGCLYPKDIKSKHPGTCSILPVTVDISGALW